MIAVFWTHCQNRVVFIWWVSPSQKGTVELNTDKEHDIRWGSRPSESFRRVKAPSYCPPSILTWRWHTCFRSEDLESDFTVGNIENPIQGLEEGFKWFYFLFKNYFFILQTDPSFPSFPSSFSFFPLVDSPEGVRPSLGSQQSLAYQVGQDQAPPLLYQGWGRYPSIGNGLQKASSCPWNRFANDFFKLIERIWLHILSYQSRNAIWVGILAH